VVMGGVLERFPELKLVFARPSSDGSLGTCTSSTTWRRVSATSSRPITELPSFYFKRNIHLTFIEDPG